jgi:tetratricopeptide (TPR) repeat protein
MLIEDGAIETGEQWDPWAVHVERLDPERVPATLTGVLQARLDSLTPADRDVLQRSSVVGRVFWDGTVDSLGDGGAEATVGSLETARRREFVFRHERSSFDDTTEYTFKHALLRDVTYETVLLRDRRRLHALVARWISEHAGDRAAEYAGVIATHLRLAGDLTGAAELLRRAGVASLAAGNSPAARRYLGDALDLWDETGQRPPVDALITLTEACIRLGDLAAADRYDDEALRHAVSIEDRVVALYLGSWIATERGERALLDEALPSAERVGGVLLVRVLTGRAWYEVACGDADAARELAERANGLAQQLQNPTASSEALATLSIIAAMVGDLPSSLDYSRRLLVVARQVGDLDGEARAHGNIGVALHLHGDRDGSRDEYEAALDHYQQAKALHRRLGRRLRDGITTANIAQIHVRLGRDDDARRLIREAIGTVRQAGGTATLMFCVLAEADRRLVEGDHHGALELIGHVRRHPAHTRDNTDEIGRILGRAGLPADAANHTSDSDVLDFDAVVDRLMEELGDAVREPDLSRGVC